MIRSLLLRFGLPVAALAIDLLVWQGSGYSRFGGDLPTWAVVVPLIFAYALLAVPARPLLGYAAMMVVALGMIVVPDFELFAGFSLALYRMARATPLTTARMALVGGLLPLAINTYNAATYESSFNFRLAPIYALITALIFGGAWLAGRAIARGDARVEGERRRSEQLRQDALRAERLRISRELHDIVGHSLTGIVLQAAGAARGLQTGTAQPDQVNAALEAIQETGSQSMRELHRLLGLMREETGIDTEQPSEVRHTLEDLPQLVKAGKAAGFAVELVTTGQAQDLDPSVEHAVFRVVQEGLSNAMKYAEPGARVEIRRTWSPGRLEVAVTNPLSLSEERLKRFRGGYGLLGLRERVHIIGGSVIAESAEGRFVLRATLPTAQRKDSDDLGSGGG